MSWLIGAILACNSTAVCPVEHCKGAPAITESKMERALEVEGSKSSAIKCDYIVMMRIKICRKAS